MLIKHIFSHVLQAIKKLIALIHKEYEGIKALVEDKPL
jgi:hypothetical protein